MRARKGRAGKRRKRKGSRVPHFFNSTLTTAQTVCCTWHTLAVPSCSNMTELSTLPTQQLVINLQETRCLWTPLFFRTTMPSVQNAETHLQVIKHTSSMPVQSNKTSK